MKIILAFFLAALALTFSINAKVVGACSTTTVPLVSPGQATPTPIPTPLPPNINTRVMSTDIVIEGEVTKVADYYSTLDAEIKVSRFFKGKGPTAITIRGFFKPGCRSVYLRKGEHLIFLGKYFADNLFSYDYYGDSQYALIEVSDKNIAEIIATTGQQPTLPTDVTPTATPPIATPSIPAPTPTRSITAQTENGNNMWLWVGLGAVVILGGGAFLLAKRRR